ncbi:MAG: type I-E CRISPR-associated protein Cse1/CasA, partial [Oribacterium parvum]
MSRFNLLEENWIRVLEEGEMKEVSLITIFENAEKYRCLAGEMATQDFAMLRFLLAVLHTVFSRVNAD